MKNLLHRVSSIMIAVSLPMSFCFAQSNGLGLQPYQVYDGGREKINIGNGNLYLTIPLVSLSGRDGHDLNLAFNYNSQGWVLKSHTPPQNGALPIFYWAIDSGGFWRLPLKP